LIATIGSCLIYIPTKEPEDVTRKARKGTESALKLWYLLLAPTTAAAPTAVPIRPPIVPPLTVALPTSQLIPTHMREFLYSLVMRLLLFFCKNLHDAVC
jgi:hypothetical protein